MSVPESHARNPKRLPLGVADIRRRLGERLVIPIEVVLDQLEVVASRSLPEAPVTGEVVVESIERGVSVLGAVSFSWEGDCRRCLEPVSGAATVTVDEIYQVAAPADSDLLDLEGDQIDLLPLVRDAVLLGLPLAPLCRPDCGGPDPDRYPAVPAEIHEATREAEAAAQAASGADPRWAALDELRLDD